MTSGMTAAQLFIADNHSCALQGVKHPRKRLYRARAHSNPLNDAKFDVPAHPDQYDWCVTVPEQCAGVLTPA